MDEVMQALGMLSVGKSPEGSADEKTNIAGMQPSVGLTDANDNDDESDTATETGSDSGSSTETETEAGAELPQLSPQNRVPLLTTSSQSNAAVPSVGIATPGDGLAGFQQRLSNANIRSPRGIPGVDAGSLAGTSRLCANETRVVNKPTESEVNEGAVVDANPLRRLRQNRMMFPH